MCAAVSAVIAPANLVGWSAVAGSDGWLGAVVDVTPEVAALFLEKNEGNRRFRKSMAGRYAATMKAGKWLSAADPIVIGKSGNILNGQHRLHAVIMSGEVIRMFIVKNVDDATFPAHDRGGKRTVADALRIDKKLSEVANVLAKRANIGPVTDDVLAEIADAIQEPHDEILAASAKNTRLFSSAPFRAAAAVRLLSGFDRDYVTGLYRALCLGHLSDMPPIAQSFVGAVMSGRVTSTSGGGKLQVDMLARAWDLFNPEKQDNRRVIVRDNSRAYDEIGAIIRAAIGVQEAAP